MAKGLSRLLSSAKSCGLIRGFEVGRGEETISHLQFADNAILFNSQRWEEVVTLTRILRCFELVLGLKINLSKSLLVGETKLFRRWLLG